MRTPVGRNWIVWAKRLVPPDCTGVMEEVVGTGTSAPTWKSAAVLSLTRTDGAESVRTRERFSEAFKKSSNSRVRPTNANVDAARAGGPFTPMNEAVVCGGGCDGLSLPLFCKVAETPNVNESSKVTS